MSKKLSICFLSCLLIISNISIVFADNTTTIDGSVTTSETIEGSVNNVETSETIDGKTDNKKVETENPIEGSVEIKNPVEGSVEIQTPVEGEIETYHFYSFSDGNSVERSNNNVIFTTKSGQTKTLKKGDSVTLDDIKVTYETNGTILIEEKNITTKIDKSGKAKQTVTNTETQKETTVDEEPYHFYSFSSGNSVERTNNTVIFTTKSGKTKTIIKGGSATLDNITVSYSNKGIITIKEPNLTTKIDKSGKATQNVTNTDNQKKDTTTNGDSYYFYTFDGGNSIERSDGKVTLVTKKGTKKVISKGSSASADGITVSYGNNGDITLKTSTSTLVIDNQGKSKTNENKGQANINPADFSYSFGIGNKITRKGSTVTVTKKDGTKKTIPNGSTITVESVLSKSGNTTYTETYTISNIGGTVTWSNNDYTMSVDANGKSSAKSTNTGGSLSNSTDTSHSLVLDSTTNPSLLLEYDNSTAERDGIINVCSSINTNVKEVVGFDFVSAEDDTANKVVKVIINITDYNNSKQQEKVDILSATFKAINTAKTNKNISTKNATRLYNFFEKNDSVVSALAKELNNDMHTDYYGAYFNYIRPFSGVIGTILGLFVLIIFILLTFTVLFDIAYITIPAFQLFLVELTKKKNGGGEGATPKVVSKEAIEAVKAGYDNNGENPMSIYLKSKVLQFALLAICILYLVSGQIYTLIGRCIDYFMGFLQ